MKVTEEQLAGDINEYCREISKRTSSLGPVVMELFPYLSLILRDEKNSSLRVAAGLIFENFDFMSEYNLQKNRADTAEMQKISAEQRINELEKKMRELEEQSIKLSEEVLALGGAF